MAERLGIRIEGPEEEHAGVFVLIASVLAILAAGATLYLLGVEYFGLELGPFLKHWIMT